MTGMSRAAVVVLGFAVFGMTLMAGFFFAFAIDVAPAMAGLDAGHYVLVQQMINRAVRNVAFAAAYFGTPVLVVAAVVITWRLGARRAFFVAALAMVTYAGGVLGVTSMINVPINETLAGWTASAPPADWQELRDRWNRANMARTIAACIAALLMIVALALACTRAACAAAVSR